MKPLRLKRTKEVTQNADGSERLLHATDHEDVLTSQGGVVSDRVTVRLFQECGCTNVEIGGKCREENCSAISCTNCHGRCNVCQKPICLEHSRYLDIDEGEPQRFCRSCFEEKTRKQKWVRAGKFCLSFFVETKNDG